ncbi:hypothetical protein N9Q51_02490 [Flavobacteriaceae bacterium]|nr:hypothetical protein [Flavobacteriaceae bacterium]
MEVKLKEITEKKIGFKIKSLNDSKRLSEIIANEIDLEISYNTIRRFFGVVKNVKASNYTLDIVSKFNGFDNYTDFIVNYRLSNKWKQEFEITKIIHKNEDDKLLEYIENKLNQTRSFNLKLIQIIRELLLVGNFNLVRAIFEIDKMNAKNFNYDDTVLIGMSIGHVIHLIDIKNKEFNELILNENFQDLVITIFVDYGNLKTYYSKIIEIIHANSSRKNILEFSKGILNLNIYFNKKLNNSFYSLKIEEDFHPILKSRIFAQYLLTDDNDIIHKLANYHKTYQMKGYLEIEYLFEIIFTSIITRKFEVMKWIIEKVKEEEDYKFFYKYEHYNNYLFMKLIYYTKTNNLTKAVSFEQNFTLQVFSKSYEKMALLYYYVYKFHTDNNLENLNAYTKLAKKVNSSFFTKRYLLEYFN